MAPAIAPAPKAVREGGGKETDRQTDRQTERERGIYGWYNYSLTQGKAGIHNDLFGRV